MNKFFSVVFVFSGAVLLQSCFVQTFTGPETTEVRKTEGFTELEVSGSFDVVIDEFLASGVRVTAPEDAMEYIRTEVDGNRLIINLEASGYNEPDMKVEIGENYLQKIILSGSGSVAGELGEVGTLTLVVAGSGKISVDVNTTELGADISGSGDIEAKGRASILNLQVSGSGNIDVSAIEAKNAKASIAGSGDILLDCSGRLEASIAGSGSVEYLSEPEEVVKSINGSGDVELINQ